MVLLLLSDMSKAFDTMNRKKIIVEELSELLNEDELHLMTILPNAKLVKNQSILGEYFPKDSIQFTFYLVKTLE